jgi:hypothetical protein
VIQSTFVASLTLRIDGHRTMLDGWLASVSWLQGRRSSMGIRDAEPTGSLREQRRLRYRDHWTVRWLVATVAETVPETPEAVTLYFEVEGRMGHRAGEHVDLRLAAEDGYSTQCAATS